MLSGARDDLVPKAHMRSLWEAVAKRGEKKTSGGKEYKVGLERAKYMEFEFGGHSERPILIYLLRRLNIFLDDTCVQTGYWPAVADFIASLGTPVAPEKSNTESVG
jgi:hypothetical protein